MGSSTPEAPLASEQVGETHALSQLQQRPTVLVTGPRPAFGPSPYRVSIGPEATGYVRPGQARLLLEPLETVREVHWDFVGLSAVTDALSRH